MCALLVNVELTFTINIPKQTMGRIASWSNFIELLNGKQVVLLIIAKMIA